MQISSKHLYTIKKIHLLNIRWQILRLLLLHIYNLLYTCHILQFSVKNLRIFSDIIFYRLSKRIDNFIIFFFNKKAVQVISISKIAKLMQYTLFYNCVALLNRILKRNPISLRCTSTGCQSPSRQGPPMEE